MKGFQPFRHAHNTTVNSQLKQTPLPQSHNMTTGDVQKKWDRKAKSAAPMHARRKLISMLPVLAVPVPPLGKSRNAKFESHSFM